MNKNKKKILAIATVVVIAIAAVWYGASSLGGPRIEPGCENGAVFNINNGTPCIVTDENGATTTVSALDPRAIEVSSAYSRIASEWTWKETTYKPGQAALKPAGKDQFQMSLNSNGKVVIGGDCNSINGSFELGDDTVSGPETIDELALGKMKFSGMVSTKKYCEKSVEAPFLKDISKVVSYEMRPSGLMLILADQQGTMFFTRSVTVEGQ